MSRPRFFIPPRRERLPLRDQGQGTLGNGCPDNLPCNPDRCLGCSPGRTLPSSLENNPQDKGRGTPRDCFRDYPWDKGRGTFRDSFRDSLRHCPTGAPANDVRYNDVRSLPDCVRDCLRNDVRYNDANDAGGSPPRSGGHFGSFKPNASSLKHIGLKTGLRPMIRICLTAGRQTTEPGFVPALLRLACAWAGCKLLAVSRRPSAVGRRPIPAARPMIRIRIIAVLLRALRSARVCARP